MPDALDIEMTIEDFQQMDAEQLLSMHNALRSDRASLRAEREDLLGEIEELRADVAFLKKDIEEAKEAARVAQRQIQLRDNYLALVAVRMIDLGMLPKLGGGTDAS